MDSGKTVRTRKHGSNYPYVPLQNGYYLHARTFSKYQGLFLRRDNSLFKYLDGVRFDADIHHVQRYSNRVVLSTGNGRISLESTSDGLRITSKQRVTAFIDLDTRFIDDYDDKGRIYDVVHDDDHVNIDYTKYHSDDLSAVAYDASFSMRTTSWSEIGEWQATRHTYDERRDDSSNVWVYRAGRVDVSPDNPVTIHLPVKQHVVDTQMQEFLYEEDNTTRVAAGYPWFYQAWSRDEIISLHPLMESKASLAKSILVRAARTGQGAKSVEGSDLASADTPGWVAKRLSQLRDKDGVELTDEEQDVFVNYFETYLSSQTFKDHLVINGELETWMDTAGDTGDTRRGRRVEIQAGLLAILDILDDLSDQDYHRRYVKTKQHVQRLLVDNGILNDGYVDGGVDDTVRPNVFLAYYLHDNMVKDAVWRQTFNAVIDACWLSWGGFSSIGQDHELFQARHTGTDNQSYHRGDSWYYVNNIAALALHDFSASSYLKYIEKIRSASLKDYTGQLAIGACSEISDAEEQRSAGCVSQAWSLATLRELLDTV